jgi:hypothetical protein
MTIRLLGAGRRRQNRSTDLRVKNLGAEIGAVAGMSKEAKLIGASQDTQEYRDTTHRVFDIL